MPDASGPFDGSPWAESQWFRHMPSAMPSGVIGTPQGAATTGPLGFASSGLTITPLAGDANVGGAGYSRTAALGSVTTAANANSTLSRRDRLVLRRSIATHNVVLTVIQGTAAATPVAPSITRDATTFDLSLFSFLVPPASGTALSSVVDERVWIASDGGGRLQTRHWDLPRTGNASDTFANGSYVPVLTGAVPSAPAGDYSVTARLVISNTADVSGFQRVAVNSVNVGSDPRADTIGNSRMVFTQTVGVTHPGGNLNLVAYYNATSGTPTVWTQGTEFTAFYLGAS